MNDTPRRRLPEELLILIVEQTSDRRTLLSMMLVCRSMHKYAERVCFEAFFASRGLEWIFDAIRTRGDRGEGRHALALLERASKYCPPRELPALEVDDLFLPCFIPPSWIPTEAYMAVSQQMYKGRLSLLKLAALSNKAEIVKFLVERDVDVGTTPKEAPRHLGVFGIYFPHATPLLLATAAGSVQAARLLLDHGADIGQSWMASLQCGSGELVSMFLKKDPGLLHSPVVAGANNQTRSPLIFALECNVEDPSSVVEVLISHGANTAWIEHVYRLRGSCVGWALERGWLDLALFFAKTYGRQQDAYDAFRLEGEANKEVLKKRIGIVEALIGRDVQVMPGWKSYFALPLGYGA